MPSVRLHSVLVLLLLASAQAAPVAAQPTSPSRFVHWLYADAAALVFDHAAPNAPRYALQGMLLLAPVSLLDRPVDDLVEEGRRGAFADFVRFTNDFGGPEATLPVVGIFVVSLATGDTRLQDAAFTSLESMVYAGMLAYGIKYAVGRVRPEAAESPYTFKPFSGHTAFPSGHATTALAVLTPWALYYPHPVTYTLVAVVGSGTAFSRIARERHWLTDVLGGAGVGVLTAQYLTRRHRQGAAEESKVRVDVVPMPNGMSLRVAW